MSTQGNQITKQINYINVPNKL